MDSLNNSEILCKIYDIMPTETREDITQKSGWVNWWKEMNKLKRNELLELYFFYKLD